MKDNSKTKMNNIVQLGCLISKLLRLFVNFLSAIVFFLPWSPTNHSKREYTYDKEEDTLVKIATQILTEFGSFTQTKKFWLIFGQNSDRIWKF
jgi:hypothetical protein